MSPTAKPRRVLAARAGALLVVALGSFCAFAQQKRAMTFMDIIEMRSVGAAKISPDGKYVIYTVAIPNWKLGKNFTDVFVAPTDGSAPPRQMTFTKDKNETQPQWARDARSFAFLSDRDGANQLYLMRLEGGEARKISDAKDGVNASAFSRDAKWLAYSAGKPEARQLWLLRLAEDQDAQAPVPLTHHATPVGTWAWSPDSAQIFFLAPDRADADDIRRKEKKFDVRIMDPERPPAHLWSISLADQAEKRWTSGDAYGLEQFTLSPDGAYLAFRSESTDRHANRLDQVDSEIYSLNLATGKIVRITENKVAEAMPHFSPDGKWLMFLAPDGFSYLRNEKLYVVPAAGGELRKLLPDWDHGARSPSWSADSKTIYFTEGIGVDDHLFTVALADGKLAQLTHERGVVNGGFDDEAGMFLLRFSDPTEPPDYYVARPDTVSERSRWVRVSRANPQARDFQLGEYQTLHWKSTDGKTVEGILVKPVGYQAGKRYPLIVQLHGGPAAASTNSFSGGYGSYLHVWAAHGYAVLLPNYRGSDAYGEKFRMQIAGDYFRQGYDDIMTGVDDLVARGIADPAKLGMMGWSAGGHWSDWTLTHTDRFKAISTGAGAVDWISMYAETDIQQNREFYFRGKPWENWEHYVAVSPLRYIQNAKTPTLIHVGEADPRVPKPQSDELFMALKKLGVPVEYIVYPGMPHGLNEPRYQMVKMVAEFNWFEKWIRGKPGWFDWKQLLASLEGPKSAEEQKETKPVE